MQKKVFYTEAAYVLGVAALALGTALMEAAGFGVSMVVAPAYLIFLKVSQFVSFFTFGMAEYMLQFLILIFLVLIMKRFHVSYLFSFITALVYGFMLDGFMALVALMPLGQVSERLIFYAAGLVICSAGVSLIFHTYISPGAYELFVKEVSAKLNININKFKTGYDCVSCVIGVVLSFAFFGFGNFEGVKAGTIICALINGWIIGRFSCFFEKHWEFKDGLKARRFFEARKQIE